MRFMEMLKRSRAKVRPVINLKRRPCGCLVNDNTSAILRPCDRHRPANKGIMAFTSREERALARALS